MRKLIPVILFFTFFHAGAQNYQCLQADTIHYFSNSSNGYLRGIRIDSTASVGDTTIYYPFRTLRATPFFGLIDTGGCWLGKEVKQCPDGSFVFDNQWGNTITIRTLDSVGSSWIFCKDSTVAYYIATIVSVDTMSFLGMLDSTKTIKITAYRDSTLNPSDHVNNFTMKLSKTHGFVQAFDLYLFPYHTHSDTNCHGIDYYLDEVLDPLREGGMFSSFSPNPDNSIFNIVSYQNPTALKVYDFNVGDYFQYFTFENGNIFLTVEVENYDWEKDSIVYKNHPDSTHVIYAFGSRGYEDNTTIHTDSGGITTTTSGYWAGAIDSISYDTTTLIYLNEMPENITSSSIYYFLPIDTSYCYPSSYYGVKSSTLGAIEWCYDLVAYKTGIGKVEDNGCLSAPGWDFPFSGVTGFGMDIAFKGDTTCAATGPVVIRQVSKTQPSGPVIYPNPTQNEIYTDDLSIPSTYEVTDLLGKSLIEGFLVSQKNKISVQTLPAGLYLLVLTDTTGQRVTYKIIKQ